MKTKIVTWAVMLGALLDTVYGVLSENAGLLAELGLSPKISKVIFALGLVWAAFSKSINPIQKNLTDGDGSGTPSKGL